jgi:pimeloyl-ACP methyl ester carboxylesterase
MARSGEHVTGRWRYERIDGAGHWLQLDAADRVNRLLLEHLRS